MWNLMKFRQVDVMTWWNWIFCTCIYKDLYIYMRYSKWHVMLYVFHQKLTCIDWFSDNIDDGEYYYEKFKQGRCNYLIKINNNI